MSKSNWATIIGVIGVVVENGRRLIIHKRHGNTSSRIHEEFQMRVFVKHASIMRCRDHLILRFMIKLLEVMDNFQ